MCVNTNYLYDACSKKKMKDEKILNGIGTLWKQQIQLDFKIKGQTQKLLILSPSTNCLSCAS